MSSIRCDKFNTFEGNGCCLVRLDDLNTMRNLTPPSIVSVVLSLCEVQASIANDKVCNPNDFRICCDRTHSILSLSSSVGNDTMLLKILMTVIVLEDWMSNQIGRYDAILLDHMKRHCDNIRRSSDINAVRDIIKHLQLQIVACHPETI